MYGHSMAFSYGTHRPPYISAQIHAHVVGSVDTCLQMDFSIIFSDNRVFKLEAVYSQWLAGRYYPGVPGVRRVGKFCYHF